ncbi:MAG: hypothetical protein NT069_29950 [Planctomycetota bacterium]|nr:hypothetical protein [Planctomycetota bacterium]
MKCWGRRHPVAAVATGIILLSGGGLAVRQEVATHQIRQESLLELTAIEESIRQMKLSEASRRLHQLEGRLEGVPRLSELRERVQTQLAWLEPAIQNEERLARFDSLRHRAEETLIATEIDEFARGVEASDEALAIFELDQLDDWTSAPRLAGLDPSTRARILDEAAALQSLSIDQQLRRQFRGESALGIGAAIFQPKERPVTTGAVVDVSAGSPVVRAGLRVGDQILRGDGHWGWNPPLGPFGTALMSKGPRRVELLVLRRGQRQPEVIEFELEADQSPGMKVGPFEQLVIQSIAPNSELAAAGCQPGDAILAINGEPAGGIARLTEGRLTYEAFNACFSTLNAVNSAEVRLTIARPSTGEVREVPFASSRPRDLSRSRFHHNLLKALMSQEYARHVRTAEVTTTAPEFVLEQVFTARSWPVELTRQVADEVIREIAAHPVMAKAYASVARGDTQTPVADLWAWCDAHPGDVDANQLLLYCLQEGNRWGACVEVSSRAIARRPLVGVYWGVRGRAYANLRETIAARRDLERALVLHPTEWVKTLLENLARAGDAGG